MILKREPQIPAKAAPQKIQVQFAHGLGDNCYFAHVVAIYARRGYQVEVNCHPSMRVLYEAAGASVMAGGGQQHLWAYPPRETTPAELGSPWIGSKVAHGISAAPMPDIGRKEELWPELAFSRILVYDLLKAEREAVRAWLYQLPGPVTLLHSKGTTAQARKSLPDSTAAGFYAEFLDRCEGTLILLDWDDRIPELNNYRVRHLREFPVNDLSSLLALYCEADLMIGVDSGPLHLARFTEIPTIGVWRPGHYPQVYSLPRPEQINVVTSGHTRQWNRFHRWPFQIVEQPGKDFDPRFLANLAAQMTGPRRYCRDRGDQRPKFAQDAFLRHLVDLTRCQGSTPLAAHWDRQRSIDVLFREMRSRFDAPVIVETGCIRSEEDFDGAGFFTYVAGAFCALNGGRLYSVDLSEENVAFARKWTAQFGQSVKVSQCDSIDFLRSFRLPIDVLYLDSLDADQPGHAEHCCHELDVALPMLHEKSLIVIDDTPWSGGQWIGKGAAAVPRLLNEGWKIKYAGYQVVLERG